MKEKMKEITMTTWSILKKNAALFLVLALLGVRSSMHYHFILWDIVYGFCMGFLLKPIAWLTDKVVPVIAKGVNEIFKEKPAAFIFKFSPVVAWAVVLFCIMKSPTIVFFFLVCLLRGCRCVRNDSKNEKAAYVRQEMMNESCQSCQE